MRVFKDTTLDFETVQTWLALRSFGRKERISLYKKLGSFLQQGIDLYKALNILFKISVEAEGPRAPTSVVLEKTIDAISREGVGFSEAIGRYIPYTEQALIASGEQSGKIIHDLALCSLIAESEGKLIKTVAEAITYPIFLIVMFLGMLVMLAINILPTLEDIQPYQQWPTSSQLLHSFVYGFYDFWFVYLILLMGFIIGAFYSLDKWTDSVRIQYADRFPPWNVYKVIHSAVLLYSLSSLMKSGIPLTSSIIQMREKSTPYIQYFIDKILDNKQMGFNDGRALNVDLLPKHFASELEAFGELQNFTQALFETAKRLMIETEESVKKKMAVFRSAAIIFIGLVIIMTYSSFIQIAQNIAQNS
jgi:type II secretory pathway component PulF